MADSLWNTIVPFLSPTQLGAKKLQGLGTQKHMKQFNILTLEDTRV